MSLLKPLGVNLAEIAYEAEPGKFVAVLLKHELIYKVKGKYSFSPRFIGLLAEAEAIEKQKQKHNEFSK